jgi:hypothetical protein
MIQSVYKILPKRFYRKFIKSKVYPLVIFLNKRVENSVDEKRLIQKLNRYKITWHPKNKNIVLTQIIEDHAYSIKLAACSYQIAKKESANIALYDAESRIEWNPNFNFKRWNFLFTEKYTTRLDKLFLSFAGKIIFRNSNLYSNQSLVNETYLQIKKNISSNHDILKIEIEGIVLGDLVYDTYLRFANKPTVDINDPYLSKIIIEAVNIFFNCKKTLQTYTVKALVSSYASYIKHGIIVRMCLNKNIPVYTIGAYYSLVHKASPEYPSHSNSHFLFHKHFEKLENKTEIINRYKEIFEKRFKGEIDAATSYMKLSAFSAHKSAELENIDWPNTVVLLAHCFFDSPHIYRSLLFPDFYEWITFTLDNLSNQKKLTVLVKQHPNGLPANDEIFAQLKEKYKNTNIKFIDKKTSNIQFFESKPKAIITAYGTAAAEFSYQGFPVLTIYDNPFTAFDFTYLAKTVEQYKELLQKIDTLEPKRNKNEIIEYYYMQHFFYLKNRNADYLGFVKYKGQTYSDDFLKDYLPKMNESYFEVLDSAMVTGFDLIEWEKKIQYK